ncbi:hypothetical protein Hanom_Chr15g01396131 [Helianthus anomalus]
MHLFQHLEDVDLVRLYALLRSLLLLIGSGFLGQFLAGLWLLLCRCFLFRWLLLGGFLLCGLWCH